MINLVQVLGHRAGKKNAPAASGGLPQFPAIPDTATIITSQPFVNNTPSIGAHDWSIGTTSWGTSGTGPISAPSEGIFVLPTGARGGGVDPGSTFDVIYHLSDDGSDFGTPHWHEVYIATVFKIDTPYAGPDSLGQKLFFIQELPTPNGIQGVWLEWSSVAAGDNQIAHMSISNEATPVTVAYASGQGAGTVATDLTPGNWYCATVRLKQASNASATDGICQVWIDKFDGNGPILQINVTDLMTVGSDVSNWSFFQHNWMWGGGGVAPYNMTRRSDHILIAGVA